VFTVADRLLLTRLCRLLAQEDQDWLDVKRFGAYREQGRERKLEASPAMKNITANSNIITSLMAKFGLSPTDRGKVTTVTEVAEDPRTRFFN
jgi:phage terminase small subunit